MRLTRQNDILTADNSIFPAHSDESAVTDDRVNSYADIDSECSSTSDSQKSKRDRPESLDRDDKLNTKNFETLSSCVVSNVLVISDRKEHNIELKSAKAEKEVICVKSPEKKVKKVARIKSKPASPPALPVKLNRDDCDWDSLFDDDGECLDPTLIDEVSFVA